MCKSVVRIGANVLSNITLLVVVRRNVPSRLLGLTLPNRQLLVLCPSVAIILLLRPEMSNIITCFERDPLCSPLSALRLPTLGTPRLNRTRLGLRDLVSLTFRLLPSVLLIMATLGVTSTSRPMLACSTGRLLTSRTAVGLRPSTGTLPDARESPPGNKGDYYPGVIRPMMVDVVTVLQIPCMAVYHHYVAATVVDGTPRYVVVATSDG